MNEQEKVHITIFQAPYASLLEHGLYVKMHDSAHPFQGTVPAEYYLPVFDGNIDVPEGVGEEQAGRAAVILEQVFSIFNTAHPAGYCGRSLSVGDIVQLEGRHYLCAVFGFTQVEFQTSQEQGKAFPGICEINLPGGAKLVATSAQDPQFPSINIGWMRSTKKPASALWNTTRSGRLAMSCALAFTALMRMIPSTMTATTKIRKVRIKYETGANQNR